MFSHQLLQKFDIVNEDLENGRIYRLPNGDVFPSVTSVLDRSSAFDKSFLERWKAKVGLEKAKRISTVAKNRGSGFHQILEKWLMNDPKFKKGAMPFDIENWIKVRDALSLHVSVVYGIELPLYSYELNAAGRTDLYCQWDSVNTVTDFKTSKRPKKREDIKHYFVQSTCYAMMIEQLYNMTVPKIVIVMINDESRYPQLFEEETSDYRELTNQIFKDNKCLKDLLP